MTASHWETRQFMTMSMDRQRILFTRLPNVVVACLPCRASPVGSRWSFAWLLATEPVDLPDQAGRGSTSPATWATQCVPGALRCDCQLRVTPVDQNAVVGDVDEPDLLFPLPWSVRHFDQDLGFGPAHC